MARHNTVARRSTATATTAAAIILTIMCQMTTTIVPLCVTASPYAASESSRKFRFGNWLSSSRPSQADTAEPSSPTPIESIQRGGGLPKRKLKGSNALSASRGKKILKKKKKRALKSATTMQSKSDTTPQMNEMSKMPSIFHQDEQKYDRYAAALSVIEGLRRIREAELERIKSKKDKFNTKNSTEKEFLLQTTKAIKAVGLTVAQFNKIGREVLSDQSLKERVSEQAYLYRMASTVNLERIPLFNDPSTKKLLASTKHKRHRVQMFARSITEIEDLRSDQMEALRQSLKVERFPAGFDLTDPQVLPLLHPEVRAVCEKFPLKAEEIVKRYGMESDEFNRMLEETRGNPLFRWRVRKYVEKAEEERRKDV